MFSPPYHLQDGEQLYQELQDRDDGVSNLITVHYEGDLKDSTIFDDVFRVVNFTWDKTASGVSPSDREHFYDIICGFFFLDKRKVPKSTPNGENSADVDSKTPSADATEKKVDLMEVDSAAQPGKDLPTWAQQNVLYANGALFALVRLFQFAFNRLETLKQLSAKVEHDPHRPGKRNTSAMELGLQIPLLRKAFP